MKRVQLYTNNANCQNCIVLKNELDKAKIEYKYNVVEHDEIVEIATKHNTMMMPIVLFDGVVIVGDARFIVDRIKQLMIKPLEK